MARSPESHVAQVVEPAPYTRAGDWAGAGDWMVWVLTAAVALTEFRKAPLPVANLAQRALVTKVVGKGNKALRAISGLPPAVPAFSVAMLYTIAGLRIRDRLRDRKKKPKTLDV